jgi:spore germination protein YaaH
VLLLVTFLLAAGCASSERATTEPQQPSKDSAPDVWGYHAYWTGDLWESYDFSRLDGLFFFELEATGDATFDAQHGWPSRWQALRERAQAAGVAVVPVVTLFDREDFIQLFGKAKLRRLFRRNIVAVMTTAGADGVQLDVEVSRAVPDSARDGFTTFVRELRPALRRENPDATLSIFAPAFDRADVFDEAALGEHVDFFVVQGYDVHYSGSETTGPVAPIVGWNGQNWQAIAERYRELGVPASKIVMSVPFYGYEWPAESEEPGARTLGRGRTISYADVDEEYLSTVRASARERADRHGLRRDDASGSPYYAYRDSSETWRQGWFEDVRSLRAKWDFIRGRELHGLAAFPLGYDGGDLLQALPVAPGARP